MSFSIYALTVAAVLFIQNAALALATPPNATTLNGTYIGTYSEEYDQDFFLGVPFAQPPLGELRFAVPQSLNTSFDGTRDATSYSSACIGYGVSGITAQRDYIDRNADIGGIQSPEWNYELSEDCLYLNVVRPANYSSYEEPLPVAVWIYVSTHLRDSSMGTKRHTGRLIFPRRSVGLAVQSILHRTKQRADQHTFHRHIDQLSPRSLVSL